MRKVLCILCAVGLIILTTGCGSSPSGKADGDMYQNTLQLPRPGDEDEDASGNSPNRLGPAVPVAFLDKSNELIPVGDTTSYEALGIGSRITEVGGLALYSAQIPVKENKLTANYYDFGVWVNQEQLGNCVNEMTFNILTQVRSDLFSDVTSDTTQVASFSVSAKNTPASAWAPSYSYNYTCLGSGGGSAEFTAKYYYEALLADYHEIDFSDFLKYTADYTGVQLSQVDLIVALDTVEEYRQKIGLVPGIGEIRFDDNGSRASLFVSIDSDEVGTTRYIFTVSRSLLFR